MNLLYCRDVEWVVHANQLALQTAPLPWRYQLPEKCLEPAELTSLQLAVSSDMLLGFKIKTGGQFLHIAPLDCFCGGIQCSSYVLSHGDIK